MTSREVRRTVEAIVEKYGAKCYVLDWVPCRGAQLYDIKIQSNKYNCQEDFANIYRDLLDAGVRQFVGKKMELSYKDSLSRSLDCYISLKGIWWEEEEEGGT